MSFAQLQPVSRYNQMLVVSVFVHCLILGTIMFMPKSEWVRKVVKPAFKVQLMELPGVKPSKEAPQKEVQQKELLKKMVPQKPVAAKAKPVAKKPPPPVAKKTVKQPVKKTAVVKPVKKVAVAKPKQLKKPVPVKKQSVKPVATPRKSPVRSVKKAVVKPAPKPPQIAVPPVSPSKNLFQELDQMAALPKKKVTPPQPKKTDSFLEEQVRELEALKASSVPAKVTRKTPLALATPTLEKIPDTAAHVSAEEHKKFEELLAAEAQPSPAAVPGKTKSRPELMEDLESISRLKAERTVIPPSVSMPKPIPGNTDIAGKQEMENLKQELASLQKGDIKVDIKVQALAKEFSAPTFKSQMHELTAPDPTKAYVAASVPRTIQSASGGSMDADVLAEYTALISKIVNGNWKTPVGEDSNKMVVARVVIYPAGKIDTPVLDESSGSEVLDNLALRAISASEPFPPFPKELKEPHLNVTFRLEYIPHKN